MSRHLGAVVLVVALLGVLGAPPRPAAQGCPPNSAPAYREDRTVYCRCVAGYVRDGPRCVVKRVVRLTAKSWIDASRITEVTWRGRKFRFESNPEPAGPDPRGDFKLYQTFVAEVLIAEGRIVSARFVPGSTQERAGATRLTDRVGLPGRIYLVNERVQVSPAKDRATFVRTVEGNPSYWIVFPDAMLDPIGSTNFTPIGNTLRLEVTPDAVTPGGEGTAFPAHRFWIGDRVFRSQPQVQPSAYFGER